MIKKYFALSLIAASVAIAGCSDDDDDDGVTTPGGDVVVDESPDATPGVGGSVYDTIVNSDQHTSLRAAIDAAGLANALDDETKAFTVFAPDDAAFAALNTEEAPTAVADLLADTAALTRVLQYHVLPATFDSIALAASVETEESADFVTLIDGESVTITNSETANTGLAVNATDIAAADLVPEVAEGETTVGVVHSIVAVLVAPEATEEPVDPGTPVVPGTPTDGAGAVQTALETAGNYSTFLGLGFLDSYEANVWTVFAPTDEAIAAAGTTPNVQDLIAVNSGALSAADLLAAGSITTNQGTEYAVTGTEEELMVDGKAAALVATGAAGTLVYSLDGILE